MDAEAVAEDASTTCESTYSELDLEIDIYDLNRMLRAAEFLQTEGAGEEDIASSARLLVEHAAKMANDLHKKYQASFTGSGGAA
jgi:hypothetical protein